MAEIVMQIFSHMDERDLSFQNFKEKWKASNFHYIHLIKHDHEGYGHFMRELYGVFTDRLRARSDHLPETVWSIYALYLIYFTQPKERSCKIPVGEGLWQIIVDLGHRFQELQIRDPQLVLQRLLREKCLLFTKTSFRRFDPIELRRAQDEYNAAKAANRVSLEFPATYVHPDHKVQAELYAKEITALSNDGALQLEDPQLQEMLDIVEEHSKFVEKVEGKRSKYRKKEEKNLQIPKPTREATRIASYSRHLNEAVAVHTTNCSETPLLLPKRPRKRHSHIAAPSSSSLAKAEKTEVCGVEDDHDGEKVSEDSEFDFEDALSE